ncbi:hypothetical protein LINPERPRIM_LOCUS8365 [Linum perenne]
MFTMKLIMSRIT